MRKMIFSIIVMCVVVVSVTSIGALDFSGIVVNDIGRPAAGATVTIENLADSGKAMSVVTDTTGTFLFSLTPTATTEDHPIPLHLYGNYPNPFNPQTRISYSIDQPSEIRFEIYNVLGQHVRTLDDGYREAGFYTVFWNGLNDTGNPCSAGVYLYRMIAGSRSITSKMLMMDSATASWISGKKIPKSVYTDSEDLLYIITITHPDAETLVAGPMTVTDGDYDVFSINRFI
ncbi:MAG: T9SS type A sorting domain-containing protein, partial [Candidatus Latescibacteria bacterium]|nr:T9SS type A sorting domain-containing protein [Candidatus Latescibacterota bacterium]